MKNIIAYKLIITILLSTTIETTFGMFNCCRKKKITSKEKIENHIGNLKVEPKLDWKDIFFHPDVRGVISSCLKNEDSPFIKVMLCLTTKSLAGAYDMLPAKSKEHIENQIAGYYSEYKQALTYAALPSRILAQTAMPTMPIHRAALLDKMKLNRHINFINPTRYVRNCGVPIAMTFFRYSRQDNNDYYDILRAEAVHHLVLISQGCNNYSIKTIHWQTYNADMTQDLIAECGFTTRVIQQNGDDYIQLCKHIVE